MRDLMPRFARLAVLPLARPSALGLAQPAVLRLACPSVLRLARPVTRLLRCDERGVIGVLVAALLGCGVLLGMGALVIDLGQIYQNRAELQNGADAGALAVAASCARGGACLPVSALSLAAHYANANASGLTGHRATVDLVCGSGTLVGCPAITGALTDCPPAPPAGTNYVDVHTVTLTGSGSGLLAPLFAGTQGNGHYQGSNVKACAQAEWGSPASAITTGFTISACSWYVYTSDGLSFAQPPPYPPNTPPAALADHVLVEHGSRGARTTGCPPYQPSGQDAPGTFGWTSDSGNCSAFIGGTSSYSGNTGVPASGDCRTVLQSAQASHTVVYVPVYSSISPAGTGVSYTLLGFAAFVITGYHLTSSFAARDWLNPANNCTGDKLCIDGYFTRGLIPSTGGLSGGGPGGNGLGGSGLGASIVKLTG